MPGQLVEAGLAGQVLTRRRLQQGETGEADAATLAAYLQDQAARLGPGALARRLAAIVDQHRRHGLQARARDPIVRAVLREARRTARPRRRPAPGAAQLIRMAGHETFKIAVARLSETTADHGLPAFRDIASFALQDLEIAP